MLPFAVLDTSALILLCTDQIDQSEREVEAQRRREATRDWIEYLAPRVRFAVPTPAVAELSRPNEGG